MCQFLDPLKSSNFDHWTYSTCSLCSGLTISQGTSAPRLQMIELPLFISKQARLGRTKVQSVSNKFQTQIIV